MLFNVAASLSLLSVAAAQYGSGGGDSESKSSSTGASAPSQTGSSGPIHTVMVGANGLDFTPNSFKAAVGDKVEFHFMKGKHSVAQAAFDKPCAPSGDSAVFSGGITIAEGGAPQIFTMTVNDTKPFWYYCAAPKHCQGGMVGVINQADSGNKTIEAFAKAAKEVPSTTAPSGMQGGVLGAAEGGSGSTPSGSGTGSAPAATSSSAASGLMEKGSYGTVVAAGVVAALAGVVGTLLV